MRELFLDNFESSNFVFLDDKFYIKKVVENNQVDTLNKISQLKSSNLKELKNIEYKNNKTFYLEEYIHGESLDKIDILKLSEKDVKKIIEDILKAISKLHMVNVIHRDIKPENIIITKNKNAILIDYNIARTFSKNKNKDTTLFGTEYYASPEQYGSLQTSFSSDIYSLGKTLREVFSKHTYFLKISKIVDKCTEFDPKNRYNNVDVVIQEINKKRFSPSKTTYIYLGILIFFATSQVSIALDEFRYLNLEKEILDIYFVGLVIVSIISLIYIYKLPFFNIKNKYISLAVNIFSFVFFFAFLAVTLEEIIKIFIS